MSVIGRTLRKLFPRKGGPKAPLAIAYGEKYLGETFMPTIRELGGHGSKISLSWSSLEPVGRKTLPDPFDWHLLDRFLEQIAPGDVALVNLFTDHPIYTSAKRAKGSLVHVNYRDKFTAMVRAVVDRCNGRVTFLQCNTEPASSAIHWPSDRADEYCDLYSLLYSAAKDVNPDVKIVGVNCAGHFSKGTPAYAKFFKTVIEHSPFDYCDCRGYQNKYELPIKFQWFRAELESCGKSDVPMICTEYGGPDPREHPLFSKYRAQYPNSLRSVPDTLKMFMSKDPSLIALHESVHLRDVFQRTVILLSDLCKAEYVFYWNLVSGGHHPIFGRMRLCEWSAGPVGIRKLYPLYQAQSYAAMAVKLAGMEKIEMAKGASLGRIYYHDGTALEFEWDPNDDFKDTGYIKYTKVQDATI